jgi:hypothetical protein
MAQGTGNYHTYLKSNHWNTIKTNYYVTRYYRCYFCGVRKGLQLHHISYENIGNEKPQDLVYLCSKCHTQASLSKEKDKIQEWLDKRRQKWLKLNKTPNLKKTKKYHKFKLKGVKGKSAFNLKKNYAGLFTWKANESKNYGD